MVDISTTDTRDFATEYDKPIVRETMAPVEINTGCEDDITVGEAWSEYLEIMGRKPEPPLIDSLPTNVGRSNGAQVMNQSIRTDSKGGKMSSVHWDWTDAEIWGGWVEFEQWPGGSQRGEASKNICAHYVIDAETGYGFLSTNDGLRKIRLRSNESVSINQPITSLPFDVVPLKLPKTHVFFTPTEPDKEEDHLDGEWKVLPNAQQAFHTRTDAWAVWSPVERALEDGTRHQVMTLLSGNGHDPATNVVYCEFPAGLKNDTNVETTTGFVKPW